VAVPLPFSDHLRPLGSVPDSETTGVGVPVALTVRWKVRPTLAVALAALVMVGWANTLRMKLWVVVPVEFVAVNVRA
jgi:hypothetical protein